jgi:hypothetical protein
MREPSISKKLNKVQQIRAIGLKRNTLKTGRFSVYMTTALGAGGRAFKSPRAEALD